MNGPLCDIRHKTYRHSAQHGHVLQQLLIRSSLEECRFYDDASETRPILQRKSTVMCTNYLYQQKVEQDNGKHVPLTIAQRTPSVEAIIVAARGMLYMSANSPNDPLPSYEPTLRSSPSIVTKMSNLPLQQASEVNTGIRFDQALGKLPVDNIEVVTIRTLVDDVITRVHLR